MGNDLALVDHITDAVASLRVVDRLENVVAQMATGKSKVAADRFGLRTLDDGELSSMYRADWMSRKIVDIPVIDALRPWRDWQADDKAIEVIEAQEKRFGVKAKLAKALKWARLHGGSAILIHDGNRDPMQPLTKVGRGGLKGLTVLNRREVQPTKLDMDVHSPGFRMPASYQVQTGTGPVETHPSRIIHFIGAERPDADLNTDAWGDSVLLAVYDAIHHAALTSAGIAELVHEAKIDVIKVKNLASQVATKAGESSLVARFSLANMLKSINNTLILDESEGYERKTTSFAALPDVLNSFLQIVSGAADIPATRLLGMAPGGLNASGDSDTRNYYDSLDSYRQEQITPALERIDDLLWQDAGGAPKDAYWDWGPLWQMSEKDKADVAEKKARTTKVYADMGLLPEPVLFEAVTNQLVEDATYPGLEAAIATLRSARAGEGEEPASEDLDAEADRSE